MVTVTSEEGVLDAVKVMVLVSLPLAEPNVIELLSKVMVVDEGVVAALAVETLLSPAALIAVILKTYGVPLTNPVTVLVNVSPVSATASVQVEPELILCSIL
jgi:hypothetical protein